MLEFQRRGDREEAALGVVPQKPEGLILNRMEAMHGLYLLTAKYGS